MIPNSKQKFQSKLKISSNQKNIFFESPCIYSILIIYLHVISLQCAENSITHFRDEFRDGASWNSKQIVQRLPKKFKVTANFSLDGRGARITVSCFVIDGPLSIKISSNCVAVIRRNILDSEGSSSSSPPSTCWKQLNVAFAIFESNKNGHDASFLRGEVRW